MWKIKSEEETFPRLIQTGESASSDLSQTKRRGRNCSVLVPFTSSKSEGLSWSDLENSARTTLLGAWSLDRTQVGESDLV